MALAGRGGKGRNGKAGAPPSRVGSVRDTNGAGSKLWRNLYFQNITDYNLCFVRRAITNYPGFVPKRIDRSARKCQEATDMQEPTRGLRVLLEKTGPSEATGVPSISA
ncbi:hypothetical protein TWF481_000983 [Arthrobotrys musiformis]|uniref:Uncharacterized protein n=1 Tax=Arthrobotrys musiformis TaxID=47236 RepID=A0AAV9WVB4_9PEZI